MRRFQEGMEDRWSRKRDEEWRGIEEEWEDLRDGLRNCAEEVCGRKRIGGVRRRGCEWWNESVERLVREKRELFEKYLQERNEVTYGLYKGKRSETKRKVKEAKREADERWGDRVMQNFGGNRKMFWKEVKRVRKENSNGGGCVGMKDENGDMVVDKEEVSRRWAGYFEGLLNVNDDRVAAISVVGNGRGMPRCERCNEAIGGDEINSNVRKLKGGKSPGVDEVMGEYLKSGGVSVIEWLARLFNGCFREGGVPKEWKSACIVPLYKGKGERSECANYRGISLLSVVGKVYGGILIDRIRSSVDRAIGEEQCGFREGRGCVDQIFAVRQLCEKYLGVNREVYMAFMDLEKAYDRIDRNALWQVLRIYGVGGNLLRAVQSFYDESRACVRGESGVSEWFDVNVGLRQG